MNERIKELADEARIKFSAHWAHQGVDTAVITRLDLKEFAELIVGEAFRAGMLYSAKKYADEGSEHFTGNDVAMFLEMEACELSDEDIKQHFGVEQ